MGYPQIFYAALFVLIAPLWNWNKFGRLNYLNSGARSNRTFMELKYWLRSSPTTPNHRSNRTFMELKSTKETSDVYPWAVLIAPLWNWNFVPKMAHRRGKRVLIAPLWNWNSRVLKMCGWTRNVLIAPLWNWNDRSGQGIPAAFAVLIAPLWNWNLFRLIGIIIPFGRSNRTFMELKCLSFRAQRRQRRF